ncbi:MAG: glycerol kinase [Omnitrophica bacterium RIFCSPLOWO2_02_FULL_45_16]|nr:MAG: glycerol kinase [Omnitrophica bacterium RIFCSPLOWO2_02_FULL_45_16]
MEYILAIDQGTTGSRVVLYDKSGIKKASAYQEFTQYFPKPGWVEHDPFDLWKSVYHSIQKVLKEIPSAKIAAIGITNQRETTVIWDKDTGIPVYNAIVWQCRRTAARCDELKKKRESEFFKNITGLPIDAYFSATKIEWILRNVPGALAKAEKGKLLFGTTDSWILWRLTGGKVHATDYTNASRTMLFNIEKLCWDKDILKKFRIPENILPEVKRSSGVFGRTISRARLPAGIPISGIAGDQQAALFGHACFEPGEIKNTYGTGSFILLNTGASRPVSKYGLLTTLACGPQGEPVYALEGAVFIAGAAIQWLRDGLKVLKKASESEKMARSIKDNGGVYFVPALVGLGAPYWDQNARGSIFGITRGTSAQHIVRAALEAMCYQTKDVMDAMQKDCGLKIKYLKVDGGVAANNFLCQFQADILRINVVKPKTLEITSLGAAYLAGLAVGYWKNADEIKKCWRMDKVFTPKMPKKTSLHLYDGWLKAVQRTLFLT